MVTPEANHVVTVSAGNASQLALVSPPSTVQSGIVSSSFSVQVEDSSGNAVSTSGKSITLGAYTSNACSTTASGTFAAASSTSISTNSSGVASFTSLTYTGSIGTVYLCATDTSDGYTLAKQAVTVSPGVATQLALVSPPSSAQSGIASVFLLFNWRIVPAMRSVLPESLLRSEPLPLVPARLLLQEVLVPHPVLLKLRVVQESLHLLL